jgi:predicted molibdopterin-dependent oxidoreductase YjgC
MGVSIKMRIKQHPILEFDRDEKIVFTFNGDKIEGYKGETISAALHAAGIKELAKSPVLHRPRGLFCAIGNCSSCLMVVDGQPNIRVCVVKVESGMKVETQIGKGDLK